MPMAGTFPLKTHQTLETLRLRLHREFGREFSNTELIALIEGVIAERQRDSVRAWCRSFYVEQLNAILEWLRNPTAPEPETPPAPKTMLEMYPDK